MNEVLSLIFALMAGIVLGMFFFGGLWWTIRRGLSSSRPALWFFGSMLLRTAIVVLGFYYVLGDDWRRLLAALLGFVIARLAVTRLTRGTQQATLQIQEADHAT